MGKIALLLMAPLCAASVACVGGGQASPDGGVFKNPFYVGSPDPFLFFHEGWYYLTATSGQNIKLTRARTLQDFSKNAEQKVIWTPREGQENSKAIWAPEIHRLNGKWWAYYTATPGEPGKRRTFVLEHQGEELWEGAWTEKARLFAEPDRWAIDGTVLESGGDHYFVWSGWEGLEDKAQNLYIAKMSSTWALEGERVLLSRPEYDWECQPVPGQTYPTVNEGPAALYTDHYVGIVYSASHFLSDSYSLGLLRFKRGQDPLKAENWTKQSVPLFKGSAERGIYSPGHNSFFMSPNGKERWFAYHAFIVAPPFGKSPRWPFAMPYELDKNELPLFGEPVAPAVELRQPAGS
jgi:GH43 family beta-xylosidase